MGSYDHVVRMWDLSKIDRGVDFPSTKSMPTFCHSPLYSVLWSTHDRHIMVGDIKGGIHVWDAQGCPFFVVQGHEGAGIYPSQSPVHFLVLIFRSTVPRACTTGGREYFRNWKYRLYSADLEVWLRLSS